MLYEVITLASTASSPGRLKASRATPNACIPAGETGSMSRPDASPAQWRPTAIVWDLDGTLVESAPDLATALNALLNEYGCQGHTVARVRPMVGGGVAKLIERGFAAAGADLEGADRNNFV